MLAMFGLSGMEYDCNKNMIALDNFGAVSYHWYGHIGSGETGPSWRACIWVGV